MTPAGILIAGYGLRGRQWHAHAGTRRDCAVVGVVDPDSRAREEAERRSLPAWPSLEEALGAVEADAVIVASPPQEHPVQAALALGAGRAVLVEKPLALSVAAGARVVEAAEAAGRPALVGHNFRHRPREIAIRGALAQLGELRHIAVTSARPADLSAHLAAIEHAPLWDIGTHHLDLLRTRLGRVPDRVSARVVAEDEGTTYLLTLAWRDGPTAIYSHREGAPVFHHHEWLQGERAGLRVEPRRIRLVTPTSRPRRVRMQRRDRAEERLLDALLGDPSAEAAAALSARASLGTVGMVEAALESLEREAAVEVAP